MNKKNNNKYLSRIKIWKQMLTAKIDERVDYISNINSTIIRTLPILGKIIQIDESFRKLLVMYKAMY